MKKQREKTQIINNISGKKTEDDINRITLSILNGQLEEDGWMRNRAEQKS